MFFHSSVWTIIISCHHRYISPCGSESLSLLHSRTLDVLLGAWAFWLSGLWNQFHLIAQHCFVFLFSIKRHFHWYHSPHKATHWPQPGIERGAQRRKAQDKANLMSHYRTKPNDSKPRNVNQRPCTPFLISFTYNAHGQLSFCQSVWGVKLCQMIRHWLKTMSLWAIHTVRRHISHNTCQMFSGMIADRLWKYIVAKSNATMDHMC